MPGQALSGIKIVDFGQYIAGPFAAMLLAEQGADVIKIERPQGDPFRKEDGFAVWNRSKKAITLDLKQPEGHKVALQLIKNADVLIENFKPGVMERLGLDYEALKAQNPRLIYCSITGFGATGPYSKIPGYEQIVEAIGAVYAEQGVNPVYVVLPLASTYTAAEAAYDIVAALCAREATGKGQKIDLSMFRTILGVARQFNIDFAGIMRSRWTAVGPLPLYRSYRAADGKYFFLALGNYKFVTIFCTAMGHEEWLVDPIFQGAPFLIFAPNNTILRSRLARIFKTKKRDDWMKLFESHGVPAAPVQTIDEFMKYRQIRANDMLAEISQPGKGRMAGMGIPVTPAMTPGVIRCPAPLPGQHSAEILESLGYGEADVKRLKLQGAVQ